jgi:hypothetical protein
MTTKDAIKVLTEALKKDSGYHYSWQANIAIAFQDACKKEGISFPQLHNISNTAALNFLDVLCMDNEESDVLTDCSYPNCGCDGARLCMAENGPNDASFNLNRERK